MKKKILTMFLAVTVCTGVMTGCSQKPAEIPSETSVESSMQEEEGITEVRGSVEEIKDFMFIITDEDKISYAFSFSDRPEGLDEIQEGDNVIVKYTGTVSEIDGFQGEIVSIEKE